MRPSGMVGMVVWFVSGCGPEPEPEDDVATLTADCEPTDNALRRSCTLTVDPAEAVSVRYAPADGLSPEREVTTETAESTQVVELAILRPDTDYTFVASTVSGSVETPGTFHTDPLPPEVASSLAVTGVSSVALLGTDTPCGEAAYGVIYDTATGDVVWYDLLDAGGKLGPVDMIQFTEDHTVLGETEGKIVEVDLAGEVLVELVHGVDYTDELHHDLFKRDGLIYAIRALGSGPPGPGEEPPLDGFYVFDAATGERVAEWDAPSFLEIPAGATGDWMHTNTIWVDAAGDIYLSSFGQNSVIKLVGDWTRPDFGTQLWALAGAEPAGFGSDYTIDWGTVGVVGFQHQHAVHRLDDGTLMLLDNAHGRALALTLDEGAGLATVEAEYSTTGTECGPQGTAAMTAAGNVLVGCSSGSLQEYAPDGTVAFAAAIRGCVERPLAARFYPLDGW